MLLETNSSVITILRASFCLDEDKYFLILSIISLTINNIIAAKTVRGK